MSNFDPRQYMGGKQASNLTPNPKPDAQVVEDFHTNSDIDVRPEAHHHSLGPSPSQAAAGNHTHNGSDSLQLLGAVTLTGSRGGNAALASVISALVALGAKDVTSA